MQTKTKSNLNILYILLLLTAVCTGQVLAQTAPEISNATYLNPSYIKESAPKTNCDLNGAWSTEYSYYWLADPSNTQTKLPPYITNLTYSGVIQESSSISISTPESASKNGERNKYYLSSSLDGETLSIMIDLQNNNDFITWIPLNLYFDPFVINNPAEQIKLKLSYANSALGDITYIQNTKFKVGCYLNLLVKSPDPRSVGTLTIEIAPQDNSKAAISGIFWSEPRRESDLRITYVGPEKVSAPTWSQRVDSSTVIWSPRSKEESENDDLVQLSVGMIKYATSTGYEFPLSLKNKDFYNFKVLQGMAGPKGSNGLEFYLNPDMSLCLNGCELGLYTTESYKQNILIYSAEKDKQNKLKSTIETFGDGTPTFQNFHIAPSSNIQLRIRLTTNDLENPPILRGLYIAPTGSITSDNNVVLNLDTGGSMSNSPSNNNASNKPTTTASTTSTDTIQIPTVINFNPSPSPVITNISSSSPANTITQPTTMADPLPVTTTTTQPIIMADPLPATTTTTQPVIMANPLPSIPEVLNTASNNQGNIKQAIEAIKNAMEEAKKKATEEQAKAEQKQAEEVEKSKQKAIEDAKKAAEEQAKAEQKQAEEVEKSKQEAIEDAKKAAEEQAKAEQKQMEEAEKSKQEAIENAKKAAEEQAKAEQKQMEEAEKSKQEAIENAKKAAEEQAKAEQKQMEEAKKSKQEALEDAVENAKKVTEEIKNNILKFANNLKEGFRD